MAFIVSADGGFFTFASEHADTTKVTKAAGFNAKQVLLLMAVSFYPGFEMVRCAHFVFIARRVGVLHKSKLTPEPRQLDGQSFTQSSDALG